MRLLSALLNAEGLALSSISNASMIQNLKLLRVQCGMTLEALAEETGLTRSYLSKVERGLSCHEYWR